MRPLQDGTEQFVKGSRREEACLRFVHEGSFARSKAVNGSILWTIANPARLSAFTPYF